MPSRHRDAPEMRVSLHNPADDESSERAKRILALRYVFTNARDRADAFALSQILGLDDLLLPALT